jgi:hypothetical protein
MIDIALYVSYGLIIVAVLGAVLFPLINSLGDPGSLIKTGAGLVGLLAIFFIAYAIASDEVYPWYAEFDVDASLSKWIGGAVITMYILIILAVFSIIITEVSKLFR